MSMEASPSVRDVTRWRHVPVAVSVDILWMEMESRLERMTLEERRSITLTVSGINICIPTQAHLHLLDVEFAMISFMARSSQWMTSLSVLAAPNM